MAFIGKRGETWRAEICIAGNRSSKTFKTREKAEAWANNRERALRSKGQSVEGQLLSMVPRRVLDAIKKAKYSTVDIVSDAIPVGTLSGVYFLIWKDEVVYVGQTVNVFHRIAQHTRNGMEFDAYNFIPCPKEDMDELERLYIAALAPIYNTRW